MIILNGASLERFRQFYDFKDYQSIWVNSLYGGAVFAAVLLSIGYVGVFDEAPNDKKTGRARDDVEYGELAPPHGKAGRGASPSGIARTPEGLHAFRGLQWQRSPWLLCVSLANVLPWLIWAPQVRTPSAPAPGRAVVGGPLTPFPPALQFNRYARSPSVCQWNQLLPGPLNFFSSFAGSTQAYTTFWATQIEGRLVPGMSRPAWAFAVAVQFLGIVCAFAQNAVFAIPRCVFEGHQTMVDVSILYQVRPATGPVPTTARGGRGGGPHPRGCAWRLRAVPCASRRRSSSRASSRRGSARASAPSATRRCSRAPWC